MRTFKSFIPVRLLFASCVLYSTVFHAFAQNAPGFTQRFDSPIAEVSGSFVTGAWADYDNNGLLDLYVVDYGGLNLLFHNEGNGQFTQVTDRHPVLGLADHTAPSWGDYDNDGHVDLAAPAGLGASRAARTILYHNNGDGSFDPVSGGAITNQLGYFAGGGWVDYDNDGFLDLLLGNSRDESGGRSYLYRNRGDGTFDSGSSGAIVTDRINGWASLWADYDNDRFMDLVVVNNARNTRHFVYHNERNGTFSRVLTNAIALDRWPDGALGGAWGDFDNDGLPDLFIASGARGGDRLYRNLGGGVFTNVIPAAILDAPEGVNSASGGWGDYDNEGLLDLFIACFGGPNRLLRNTGDGAFEEVFIDLGGPSFGNGWVDFDNDGFLDLFVVREQIGLYRNDTNTNSWVEVKCVGTASNRSGIGTKVRVQANIRGQSVWQMREITEGGGGNRAPLLAHFGLGDASAVETLRIEWPSGAVQEFVNVPVKHILTFTEPPRLLVSSNAGQPQITLKGQRGARYHVMYSTDLKTWSFLTEVTIEALDGIAPVPVGTPERAAFYRAQTPPPPV